MPPLTHYRFYAPSGANIGETMLHIAITLLATALLASSTGANVTKNYETHEERNNTALKSEPKKAYYDPEGDYGATNGYIYNYSYKKWKYTTTANATEYLNPNENVQTSTIRHTTNFNYVFYIELYTGQNAQDLLPLDVYIDNVLATEENGNIYVANYTNNSTWFLKYDGNNNKKIWIFDKDGTIPNTETIEQDLFDAVGDTITGLSDALASPWEGILNIFYDTTESEVTQMGYLVLIGLGVSITLLVFWTILRLFKQRN